MAANIEVIDITDDRSCGDCTLCCKLLAVGGNPKRPDETFEKPIGKWCQHCMMGEEGRGCRIYEDRPKSCKDFACAWLMGLLPDDMRPDQTKVVVSLEEMDPRNGPWPCCWNVYENIAGVCFGNKKIEAALLKLMDISAIEADEEEFKGPFPICIIPPDGGKKWLWLPGDVKGRFSRER